MKTMGLSDLFLVSPSIFPDPQADAMASGADDVLNAATVVSSLAEAVADCQHIIGTSARSQRTLRWRLLEPRECGTFAAENSPKGKVAIVFGRERTGLTNEELELCHQLVHIPSNPDYSSLNVASAVQILSYECRVAHLDYQKTEGSNYCRFTSSACHKRPQLAMTAHVGGSHRFDQLSHPH
ncbi:UNVERIFIED_CONTAM: hypothetical protein GTU68_048073 [Idotea baltica]|nr:hypothetical protein [Idotea baltica]